MFKKYPFTSNMGESECIITYNDVIVYATTEELSNTFNMDIFASSDITKEEILELIPEYENRPELFL